ncbi:uncharacterized protein LOC111699920 isoform X2 [Eurytemora carolleeae]|uniref:uncharacterized protein LOC111699920 isoform X2 n=1 Tax=Eurytemora carolleeae TaxID=1294199 RepID=UPI000C786FAC|nr:uncharacterized protein LOC111699920 isoform X2 [Eurytemora carolleeae]|eukprot:XP_023326464.1 uncharacterized protein LOC111699920 isoform X2 [Eurytemora affinis]
MSALSESSSLVRRPSNKDGGVINHDWPTLLLVFAAFITFVVTAAFNGLNGSGAGLGSVFINTVGNISDKYYTYVTPAGFTFTIWSVIYLWIAISLVALIVSLFMHNQKGRLYLNPLFASPLLMVTMSVNFILNLAWIFIFDREYLIAACVILILIAATGIAVVGMMARNVEKYSEEYAKGTDMFIWGILYRFMMNGFAVYATWTVIASLLNFTIALVYAGDTDLKATSLAALSLLVIFHVTWFILENFVFDKYVRYLLTPYNLHV